MSEEIPNKSNKSVFFFIVIALIFGFFVLNRNKTNDTSLKIPFPTTSSALEKTSFGCEALLAANVIGSPNKELVSGIEGSLDKGTDKIAMNIKDAKTLNFLTGASLKSGVSEGDNFIIVVNNNKKLMAFWFNENVMSTIALNKSNGLAVWTKSHPEFPLYGAPEGFVVYLSCK